MEEAATAAADITNQVVVAAVTTKADMVVVTRPSARPESGIL